MIIVQRGNVVLRVKDDLRKYYLESGYNVIDESGKVVEKTTPTDLPTLQAEYRKNTAEIAALKAEIAELKKALTEKSAEKVAEKTPRKRKNTEE